MLENDFGCSKRSWRFEEDVWHLWQILTILDTLENSYEHLTVNSLYLEGFFSYNLKNWSPTEQC